MTTLETPTQTKPTDYPRWEMPPEQPDPDLVAMIQELEALDLPDSDGEPIENERERIQIDLSLAVLDHGWRERADFYAGGNMFVYYSIKQAREVIDEIDEGVRPKKAFRGPDLFVVLNVDGSYRRQKWVVWEEDGRYPDVIIELLSPKTRAFDLGKKKTLYEQTFGTDEYFCFDYLKPDAVDSLLGWRLDERRSYKPIKPDSRGWLWSEKLGLWLGKWQGTVLRDTTNWLRFYSPEGELILTQAEAETAARQAAEAQAATETAARQAAEAQAATETAARQAAEQRIEAAESTIERLQAELARLRGAV